MRRGARQPQSAHTSDAKLRLCEAGLFVESMARAAARQRAKRTAPINTACIPKRRKRSAAFSQSSFENRGRCCPDFRTRGSPKDLAEGRPLSNRSGDSLIVRIWAARDPEQPSSSGRNSGRFCPEAAVRMGRRKYLIGWWKRDLRVGRGSDPRVPRNDGQIGTSLRRAGALRDIERRDRAAKTL
jgi:hypothetical protein